MCFIMHRIQLNLSTETTSRRKWQEKFIGQSCNFSFYQGLNFKFSSLCFWFIPQKAMVNVELIHCTQTLKLVGTSRKGMTNGKQDRRPTSLTAQESDNVVHLGPLKVIQWFMRPTLPVSWATSPRTCMHGHCRHVAVVTAMSG